MVLNAGIYTLRMKVLAAGFNLNWFEFEFVNSLSTKNNTLGTLAIYPNPIAKNFQIKLSNLHTIKDLKIIDINGRLMKKLKVNLKRPDSAYNLSNLKAGIYFLILETDKRCFQKKIIKI